MIKTKLIFLCMTTLLVSACDPYDGSGIAEGFIQCRVQFDSSLKTLSSAASSLDSQKKLEILGEAITARQQCEDSVISRQK